MRGGRMGLFHASNCRTLVASPQTVVAPRQNVTGTVVGPLNPKRAEACVGSSSTTDGSGDQVARDKMIGFPETTTVNRYVSRTPVRPESLIEIILRWRLSNIKFTSRFRRRLLPS